jgi:hypothetical protein
MNAEGTLLALARSEKRRAVRPIGNMELSRSGLTRKGYPLKGDSRVSRENTFKDVSRFGQRFESDDPCARAKLPVCEAELSLVCSGVEQSVRPAEAYSPQVLGRGRYAMRCESLDKVGAHENA